MKRIFSTIILTALCAVFAFAQGDILSADLTGLTVTPVSGDTYEVSGNYNDPTGVTAGTNLQVGDKFWTPALNAGDTCRVMSITSIESAFTGFVTFRVDAAGQGSPSTQNAYLVSADGLPSISGGSQALKECASRYYAAYVGGSGGGGGGSGPIASSGEFLYVSQAIGNNGTAVKGDITKPWADPWAAKAAASDNDIIYTTDGRWVLDTIGGVDGNVFFTPGDEEASSLTARKDLTYFFEYGTAISSANDTHIPIFYDTTGADIQLLGGLNIYYKEYAVNALGRAGAFGGNNIQEDGTNGTIFNVHVDTLWIGDTTNTYWRQAFTAGNCTEFNFTGNYHRIHRAWSHRGFGSDTISTTMRYAFKEGYWTRTDVTMNPGRVIPGGAFIMEFEKLTAEIEFYAIDNVWNEGDIIFRCKDLRLLKSPTNPNQDYFFRGSYTNASRLAQNARWIFDVDNCISDSVSFHTGVSHRYDPGTNNRMIFRGNYDMRGAPVFTNNGDANVNRDQMEYIIQGATVRAQGSPAVIMNDSSAVTILNSIIEVTTGEPAIQLESNGFRNLTVTNSTLQVADTTAAIQAVPGDYVATIRGSYASNGILDPDVTLIVEDPYGTVPSSGTGGGPNNTNTWYVHPTLGDDTDGEIGNPNKPLQTTYALRDSLVAGQVGYFLPGSHTVGANGNTNVLVSGTSFYIAEGAELTFDNGANTNFFTFAAGETFKIFGPGKLTFANYFPFMLDTDCQLEILVDEIEASGYIWRQQGDFDRMVWRSKLVTLTDRSLFRMTGGDASKVQVNIDYIDHTNTNAVVDYPVILIGDASGYKGLDSTFVNIEVGYCRTNSSFFEITASTATGAVTHDGLACNISVGNLEQYDNGFPVGFVFGIGGSDPQTFNNSLFTLNIDQANVISPVFSNVGSTLFGALNFNNSQVLVTGAANTTTNAFGSYQAGTGLRDNTGTFDASSFFSFDGQFVSADTSAVMYGTGFDVKYSGEYTSPGIPFLTNSDATVRSATVTSSTASATTITSTTAVTVDVCAASLTAGGSVALNDICSGGGSSSQTSVANINALKAFSEVSQGAAMFTNGYYSINDGGGGLYFYDEISTATDNGGSVIAPTFPGFSGTGRWILQPNRNYAYELMQFGAVGDSTTLDQTAWDNWLDACIADKTDGFINKAPVAFRIDNEASARTYDGIKIYGAGLESKIYYGGTLGRVIIFRLDSGSQNVVFDNFQVRISSQKNTVFGNGVFCASGDGITMDRITVTRIHATNEVKTGSDGGFNFLSFYTSTVGDDGFVTNVRIKDNYVFSYGKDQYGIQLTINGQFAWIQDNTVILNESGQNGIGNESFNAFSVYGSWSDVVMTGNYGRSGHSIFAISPGRNVFVANNTAKDCTIPVEAAYEVEWKDHNPDTTSYGVTFENNRSEGCTYGFLVVTRDYTTIANPAIYAPPHRIRINGHQSYQDGVSLHIADQVNAANPWETDQSTQSYDIQISDFQSVESTLSGENAAAIQIFNGYKIMLDGFQIVDPAGSGITLGRDQADFFPQNVSIKNGQIFNPVRSGVQSKGCDSLLVINSVEVQNPGIYGVGAFNASDHDHIKIDGLTVVNSVQDGVYFRNQTDAKTISITNSSFINIGDRPFDVNLPYVLHDGNTYYEYVNSLQSNGAGATTVAGDNIDIQSP